MPRTVDPWLLQAMERANPNVQLMAEISAPDLGRVLRRWEDQYSQAPPRVSEAPATSSAGTPNGGLTLRAVDLPLATFPTANANDDLDIPNLAKTVRGVAWTPAPTLGRVTLRQFKALLKYSVGVDMELQIYRPVAAVGYESLVPVVGGAPQTTLVKYWSFEPLLPSPAVCTFKQAAPGLDGSLQGYATFDLTGYNLTLGPFAADPMNGDTEHRPYVLFVVAPINAPKNDVVNWRVDTTTAPDVVNVGNFSLREWRRTDENNAAGWKETIVPGVNAFVLTVASYEPTSQLVYVIDLGANPNPASIARVVFERGVPPGCAATVEISTAGAGGPWTAVTDGTRLNAVQRVYHARVTLTADTALRQAPIVSAVGVETRIPVDVNLEARAELLGKEVSVPFLESSIGEGALTVVRTGRRDYHDVATDLGSGYPSTKLEADLYLGSFHPKITREHWLLLDRATVSDRTPTETSERFTLLSYAKDLKRNVPQRIESISRVHTVTAATVNQLTVTPNLSGASAGGNEYDAKGYYIRLRTTSLAGVLPGYVQTIDGNTGVDRLDFTTALPFVLAVGDTIEVHSGIFNQPALVYINADPADVWWDLLTVQLQRPAERIGRGDLGRAGRAGLPPTVKERQPGPDGDAAIIAARNKLKITLNITREEDAAKLLDQVSFIMGGVTTEIGGQIVYRQIYPITDKDGTVVISGERPVAAFDVRDVNSLSTPVGLEGRLTTVSCDYGVDSTTTAEQPEKTVVFSDGDAVAWLAPQAVDGLGFTKIPDEVARWLYNAEDAGRFLAQQLCERVVRAASTGLREWSWKCIEPKPWLCLGDVVTITTDQYTDYDPRRKMRIAGRWTFTVVLVGTSNGGRDFRGFMLGLEAASPAQGGAGDLGAQPIPPAAGAPQEGLAVMLAITEIGTDNDEADYRATLSHNGTTGPPLSVTLSVQGFGVGTITPSAPQIVNVPVGGTVTVDYVVNRQAALHGQGRVVWTAIAAGYQDAVASADPRDWLQDAAQDLTLAIDDNGDVTMRLSGANNHASWRYAWSTSAMPSDATILAGTIVNAARTSVAIAAALALGATIYVGAVPYEGASATGLNGQLMNATATRANKVTSKRLAFFGGMFLPRTQATTFIRDRFGISNAAAGSQEFYAEIQLPNGVTITAVESTSFRLAGSESVTIEFLTITRATGADFTYATHTNTTSGANQTITSSSFLTVVDNTTYIYAVRLTMNGSATAQSARVADFAVTYTQNNLAQGV